jgi:hypothetical protein
MYNVKLKKQTPWSKTSSWEGNCRSSAEEVPTFKNHKVDYRIPKTLS